MARRYYCPQIPESGSVLLDAETSHHVVHVMRLRSGDPIVLFDGAGSEAHATLSEVCKRGVRVVIGERHRPPAHRLRRIELAFSPPRSGRLEQILEHGTELGVAAFRPVLTERTPPAARRPKLARWEKILIAAAAQCGSNRLPKLFEPTSMTEIAATIDAFPGDRWLAQATPDAESRDTTDEPAIVLVGPEGGFTDGETDAAFAAGCRPLDLGPHTLRVETAALAACTLLLHGRR